MVQTDETLGWKLSSVDECPDFLCTSEQDQISILLKSLAQPQEKSTFLGKVSTIVSKMISGWRIPACAKRNIAEQLSTSIVQQQSNAPHESFEKILSESLRRTQYTTQDTSMMNE